MPEILLLIERLTTALQDYDSADPYHVHAELITEAQAFVAGAAQPIDLDALLSPRGAYEPGDGSEDGAQRVNQLEWWAPLHGCETLDDLLERIKARILPHVRPPVEGIDLSGPDGDWANLADLCRAEGVEIRSGVRLLKRAREAWQATATLARINATDKTSLWKQMITTSDKALEGKAFMDLADIDKIMCASHIEAIRDYLANAGYSEADFLALLTHEVNDALAQITDCNNVIPSSLEPCHDSTNGGDAHSPADSHSQ